MLNICHSLDTHLPAFVLIIYLKIKILDNMLKGTCSLIVFPYS